MRASQKTLKKPWQRTLRSRSPSPEQRLRKGHAYSAMKSDSSSHKANINFTFSQNDTPLMHILGQDRVKELSMSKDGLSKAVSLPVLDKGSGGMGKGKGSSLHAKNKQLPGAPNQKAPFQNRMKFLVQMQQTPQELE